MRRLMAVCGLAALAVGASPAHAFCGFYAGKADAGLFNEASQVVVVRDGDRTVLSMLNDYKGPLREFVLVVPTPTVMKQGQVRIAERATFDRLDSYSAPRLAEYHDSNPCTIADGRGLSRPRLDTAALARAKLGERRNDKTALGVTVEARYTLGEYDIVSLSATQSNGLETWLRSNGYRMPRGAAAAFKPYINQGMKFFVAKVNLKEQLKTGYTHLRPLQFAFESEKFMLPMRLGMLNAPPDKEQDLIVYLLTKNGRVESANYRTVPLPANMNLPHFVKPRFADFYKALFDRQARQEEHRVVFTEYFWDMAWCDPCAADPLSAQELRNAGVFWVGGDAGTNFQSMLNPSAPPPPLAQGGSGAQPVVLTRLHLRYTASSFPEDLVFTQTRDRQNWQARYVIQNPYQGSVAQCAAELQQADCDARCTPRVNDVLAGLQTGPRSWLERYQHGSASQMQAQCVASCRAGKQEALTAATRYYQRELPQRLAAEKRTLADLTGWSPAEIDAMPDARRYSATQASGNGAAARGGVFGWLPPQR